MSIFCNNLVLLIKPASSLCNLRCKYCFYEDESENRLTKSYGKMSFETADKIIKSAVEATSDGAYISIGFQGGEPTIMGLDFFRHFIQEEKKYKNRVFYNSIQTNGYLLDEEWARFFKENNFLVGISIDGYEGLHNLHRVNAEGLGTFERIKSGLQFLIDCKVEFNALTVVTKQCAQKPHRVYQRLKQMGFRYLQFIACLDPIGHKRGTETYSLLPEEYGQFLCAVFDDWYNDWESGNYTSVRQFEDYVHLMIGEPPSSCASSGKCGTYVVVEADGSMFPCDFYVLDDWNLGTVTNTSIHQAITSEKAVKFRSDIGRKPADCSSCKWERICHGGCKRDISFGLNQEAENYYCQSYKFFFEYAFERLQKIAEAELQAKNAK